MSKKNNFEIRTNQNGEWRTLEQLRSIGREPKKGVKPVPMYTNGFKWEVKDYYLLSDTQRSEKRSKEDKPEDPVDSEVRPTNKLIQQTKKQRLHILKSWENKRTEAETRFNLYKNVRQDLSFKYRIMNRLLRDPKTNVIVYDLETTGLKCGVHGIVQIGIVDKHGNTLFDSYIKPEDYVNWTSKSKRMTGITEETVKDAPTIEEVRDEIQSILDWADVVVGYSNSQADDKFLSAEGFTLPKKNFDVMKAFSEVIGNWNPNYKRYLKQSLRFATQYYGYKWDGKAHNALADAKATLYVLKELCRRESKADWNKIRLERRKKRYG